MDQNVLHNLRLEIKLHEKIPTKNLDNALHELTDMVKGFIFANVSHSK